MGVHYIDTDALVDPTLDPLRPEALVFVPGPDGQLRLGAVEYIVPMSLWEGKSHRWCSAWHLHELEPVPGVHVWGLHVWLFERNPNGLFADWNPRVSCGSLERPRDGSGPSASTAEGLSACSRSSIRHGAALLSRLNRRLTRRTADDRDTAMRGAGSRYDT
jgi:hypothetical protein